MKKQILAIAIALSLPLLATAGEHGKDYMEHMQQRLDLNQEQQTQMREIFKNHHAEMEKLRDRTHQQVDAILNDEQRAEMAKIREQRRQKWQAHKGHEGKQRNDSSKEKK